jgi:general stress protein 26
MDVLDPNKRNTSRETVIANFKKLVDLNPVCLFTTMLDKHPLTTRPMSVRKVCDQGNFWFLSSIDSNKNIEIGIDDRVQLFFVNVPDSEFISVYGKAVVITDKDKIEELWHQMDKVWFIEGTDDLTLSVIKVKPMQVNFWDPKRGQMAEVIPHKVEHEKLVSETLADAEEEPVA